MIRRNGKPTSCEPCRVSKVRCDHTTPVCRRCQSRGNVSQCFYHPAPLTKGKPQGVRPQRRAPKEGTPRPATQAPIPNPVSDHSQFLGPSSYLSVFRHAPLGVSKDSNRFLHDEFEHWRTDQAYASARLVYLASAIPFYHDQISWYYQKGRFTIIPAPLVLDSLSRAREYIESNPWDVARNWKSLYEDITAATALPLKISGTLSAQDFYALTTGPNLRWELLGFVFTMAGVSVMGRYRSQDVLDLGIGEMDVETFTKEMVLASNACIEICKHRGQVNDLGIWMRYLHVVMCTEVLGETSERAYSQFGDLVSDIYAMGLHHPPLEDMPLFLAETRKRMLSVSHRADKNLATLFGRPPRLPHSYCNATLPLDIADDDLLLNAPSLHSVLEGLDDDGWNIEGKLLPATVIRIRHILSTLREQVLELSLGCKAGSDHSGRLLKTYNLCQEIADRIPARFRYIPTCWKSLDAIECLARSIIHFEYLFSILQFHRIRCRESNHEATGDLLDTCLQVLSVFMDLTRQNEILAIRKQFPWILLGYGIPAAGVLVTELHSHTQASKPLPSAVSRSEVIRTLSVLISWLQTSEMSPSTTAKPVMELTKVISRLLDDTLNYQPGPSIPQDTNQNATTPAGQENVLDSAVLGSGIGAPSEAFGIGLSGQEFLSWLDDLDLDLTSSEIFV
ncbi:hypothetical protein BO70DRAFT_319779 [Aspergillus heteromorphus CBS 117.55]|uniref:Zn(2)-C6 fungal-type domain-containing protein n=1 Tax=Aspergillus heteromorphus CBS 117.55 TaxID=1448321 RepID=A0A317VK88_9EURO|nr:uncharacterized protein BO70DRAFT_319779 [Aspergillus heteromorphus CBS 117.55]PWY73577.1 hypothetical protein BO70DRAFT_319779 [Aspergillus heteromorphus CBS 117.55]